MRPGSGLGMRPGGGLGMRPGGGLGMRPGGGLGTTILTWNKTCRLKFQLETSNNVHKMRFHRYTVLRGRFDYLHL